MRRRELLAASLAVPTLAADVKVGILGDLTGPIESLAPPIVAGAQLAFSAATTGAIRSA